jgi:MurNAc alpha-1-phosphate uridylyltransferase
MTAIAKAMIFAAGKGTRMGELTQQTSKVLLPLAGKSLIDYHLEKLAAIGVKEVVINLHHKADMVQAHIGDGHRFGLKVCYSNEKQLLGPAGGVYNALEILGDEPFILISGDTWSDYSLANLPPTLDDDAFIVLVDNPDFHLQGDFQLHDGRVQAKGEHNLTYAGIGLFRPIFFLPNTFDMTPLFTRAIENERISGEHYQGSWANLNTPEQLATLEKHLTDTGKLNDEC